MTLMGYFVKYLKEIMSGGDYRTFLFSIQRHNDLAKEFQVRVSGSFLQRFNSTQIMAEALAARIVEEHLNGMIPNEYYQKEDMILITSSWYTQKRKQLEVMDTYKEFKVVTSKPPLGFKKS